MRGISEAVQATQQLLRSHPSGVVVACSGGPDSSVLAFAAAQVKIPARLVHVNHHLEADCHRWEARVRALGERLKLPVQVAHVDGARIRADQRGLEAAARDARYAALAELSEGLPVLTAHTASDRWETVLMRLLQGAGLGALAGPRSAGTLRGCRVIRPMLHWTRDQVEAALAAWGWEAVRDPSNADPAYLRAQIRPPAAELAGFAQAQVWQRSLDRIAEDAQVLEELVAQAVQGATLWRASDVWLLKRGALARMGPGVQSAVLHQVLTTLRVRPDEALVRRARALIVAQGATRARGVRLESWGEVLRVQAGADTRAPLEPLELPPLAVGVGEHAHTLGTLLVSPWRGERAAAHAYEPYRTLLDLDAVEGAVTLRRGEGAEPMQAAGKSKPRALSELAKEAGMNAAARAHMLVLADEGGPLWLIGGRPAARAKVGARTTRAWALRWDAR